MAARTGVEARTAPAMPACQSRASISATAAGRFSGVVAGNTARATPAALAIESAPPMRVVFLVAKAGKPRSVVASGSELLAPRPGRSPALVLVLVRLLRPHAATARAASRQTMATAGRRIRRPTVREAGDGCAGPRAVAERGRQVCITSRASGRLPRINAESLVWSRGTGDPEVGASLTVRAVGGAGSFSASPSANPAGRRKRFTRAGQGPVDEHGAAGLPGRGGRSRSGADARPAARRRSRTRADAARRHRRRRLRRRLPADGARRGGPDRQRRRLRARPGARSGQAGHLGRQPDRRDALPPRRRSPPRLHRPRLRLLGHGLVRDARRGPAGPPARLLVLHALRRGAARARGSRSTPTPATPSPSSPGCAWTRARPAIPPAARARAGARTCARRAATGRATPSACSVGRADERAVAVPDGPRGTAAARARPALGPPAGAAAPARRRPLAAAGAGSSATTRPGAARCA